MTDKLTYAEVFILRSATPSYQVFNSVDIGSFLACPLKSRQ